LGVSRAVRASGNNVHRSRRASLLKKEGDSESNLLDGLVIFFAFSFPFFSFVIP
jgi:hypothetical protein